MKKISKRIKTGIVRFFSITVNPFSFLHGKVPFILLKHINPFPFLKKAALFLLIFLVIVSFIITSLPHIFLS